MFSQKAHLRTLFAVLGLVAAPLFAAACGGSDTSMISIPAEGGAEGGSDATQQPDTMAGDTGGGGDTSSGDTAVSPDTSTVDTGSGDTGTPDTGTPETGSPDAGVDAPCSPATTCPAAQTCGTAPDNCGGTLNCGTCTSPQTCGGGGTANACGCTPATTCPAGENCGSAPDGCGGTINCGTCTLPQMCGGGGTANVCGMGVCVPKTTCPAGENCGTANDGCGGTINCGNCTAPQTCGGAGTVNVCGCTSAMTCPAGDNCGSVPDGCGGTINCGTCTAPQTCGGGGTQNVCGGSAVCGNGIREGSEQCDDGNNVNLDGCDSTCRFEQETRATTVQMQFAPDAVCAKDVLGAAIGSNARAQFQMSIDGNVTSGAISIVFKYFDIVDLNGLTGTTAVASYAATPVPYMGAVTGNSDLDWWYTLNTSTAGATPLYLPTAKESPGTFSGGALNASGGHVLLPLFGNTLLDMAAAAIHLPIGGATTPATSAGGPPGHLVSEHLDPNLTSFDVAGGTNAAPTGSLCGNITAASMATAPVPAALQTGGTNACNENYGPTNTALDLFVGGCHVTFFNVTVIAATQPDLSDPDATPAGGGAPYKFSEDATRHVNGCKDKNGATVTPYTSCLAPAAYSTYLKFAADRVILKHP